MTGAEHYFDWAATAPADEEIWRASLEEALAHWGNPSSIHVAGTDAKAALEQARERAAAALGVSPATVFFTSGGTESDHIPLLSLLARPVKGSAVVSAIEHPALREMARMVTQCGWRVITVSPDKDGFVQPDAVLSAVADDTAFVTVMAVNNETGAIQPVADIAKALASRGSGRHPLFHVDCVQAAGKIPLDLAGWGIDAAAFSAHKIGGPRGIGLLYLKKELTAFLRGGGQEKGVRSGTENVFGAIALARCLEKYAVRPQNAAATERLEAQEAYTARFIAELSCIPGCTLIPAVRGEPGTQGRFSPWIVQASFRGIPGQVLERALSADGYCISTGSACSSGRHARPVLDAMHLDAATKEGAVRFSFGAATTEKAMQELLERLRRIAADFGL